jgi:putative Holliday junction resolvase
MKIMALDVGDRTIGVATCDELEICASPRIVLPRNGRELDAIARFVTEEEVEEIVVGMPVSLGGFLGPQAQKVEAFVEALRRAVPVPIHTWDERMSTVEAERILLEADASRARRKRVIDKVAATVILQSYLRHRALQKENLDR